MAWSAEDERDAVERAEACRVRFAKRLRAAMSAAGFSSLAQFADAIGVSPAAVKHWYDAQRSLPSVPVLMRAARRLGVSIDWLLGIPEDEVLRSILRSREISARMPGTSRAHVQACERAHVQACGSSSTRAPAASGLGGSCEQGTSRPCGCGGDGGTSDGKR